MKKFITKILNRFLKKTDYQMFNFNLSIDRPFKEQQLRDILYSLIKKEHHENFFFIQIGANDGISFDPINSLIIEFDLTGLCLEPIKEYYNQLVSTYKETKKVTCLNLAIHPIKKIIDLYKVDSEHLKNLPDWSKGIASLNADHHKLSGTPSESIKKETVDAISFKELIQNNNIKSLDLLSIDTEGFDLDIIQTIDFENISPIIIVFEHLAEYQNIKQALFNQTITTLSTQGYLIYLGTPNIIAYKAC